MRGLLAHLDRRAGPVLGGVCAVSAVVGWYVRNRERRPYGPRWLVEVLPRPTLSRARLLALLDPAPGERVLEVGPGYGYYSLEVARRLAPTGELHLVDILEALLDETVQRAHHAGVDNVVGRRGDAMALPFDDDEFSAAYLVACLGEIDDGARAVRELARVLKPGGRLLVGETLTDPHRVNADALARWTTAAGLRALCHTGRISYWARFGKPTAAVP